MVERFPYEASMKGRTQTKLLREGDFVAEVDVELLEEDGLGWGPYFSASDALKLDDVRRALREGNLREAGKLARVFRLTPVSAA